VVNRPTAEQELRLDAERGRVLIEESRETVVVLDERDTVVAASRRAREAFEGVREGLPLPAGLLDPGGGRVPLAIPYELGGRLERLVYLGSAGDLPA
jgi:hypothetical protein